LSDYDLVIENAQIYTSTGLVRANVGVQDGVIATLTKQRINASKKLNMEGKIILPGIIDTHAHIREPGFTYKEDFETGSKAAAAGGVTTVVDMPNVEPPTNSAQTFMDKRKIASSKSIVDFNHCVFPTPSEVAKIAEAGAIAYKIFMVKGAYPHDPRICVEDHAKLYEIFVEVQKTGLPCYVHPSNMSLFEAFYAKQRKEEPKDEGYISFGKAYTEELLYGTSVSTLVMLAKRTGVRLHLVHTHSEMAIELVQEAKKQGYAITAEVDPKYFIVTREELQRLGPLVLPGGLLSEHRVNVIWEALKSGIIDVLGTDHAPHTSNEVIAKFRQNPWEAPFGCPQLEHYVSVFLNEVNNGRLRLDQFVGMAIVNPAKLLNLFPKKGTIEIGCDADLVVVDMKKEVTLSGKKVYTKVGWTPYEGRKVRGVPVMTIRRGEIIMEEGEILAKPGSGIFVPPLPRQRLMNR
jgi:dihydroorotase (multifunctional complex type)